jgi:saccharopine dehydrogenase (NAD+, L-lysine-forming)
MNVLLLGVGAVGSVIARHLSGHRSVGRLTLADFDTTRAARLREEIAAAHPGLADRLRVEAVDASDPAALARACRDQGLVLCAVVPRFNGAVMDAALAAGAHYLDMAAGEEDQFLRHEAWRQAGLVAVNGMGEDPGISNVLARVGADRLDAVETVRVRDGEFSEADDLPLACLFSTETFIEEATSPALEFLAGAYCEHPPWSGREVYPFPDPVGPQPIYNMSHEEVDTLPRFLGKGVRNVDFKLAIPDGMRDALDFLHRIGMTRRDEVSIGRARVRPLQVLAAVLPQPADLGGRIQGAAIVLVEVEGRSGSTRTRHTLHVAMTHDEAFRRMRATATAFLTGTGAAAGALAITTGQAGTPGVLAPEQLDPAPILVLLAELGLRVQDTSQTLP